MEAARFTCGQTTYVFSPPIQLGGRQAPPTLAALVAIALMGPEAPEQVIAMAEDQARAVSLDGAPPAMQLIMLREMLTGKHQVTRG